MTPIAPRELSAERSVRLHALVQDIHARLAPICPETPTELFDEMVLRIANVQLRYEMSVPGARQR